MAHLNASASTVMCSDIITKAMFCFLLSVTFSPSAHQPSNYAFSNPQVIVFPRCALTLEALRRWRWWGGRIKVEENGLIFRSDRGDVAEGFFQA